MAEKKLRVAIFVPPFASIEYPNLEAALVHDACVKAGAEVFTYHLNVEFSQEVDSSGYSRVCNLQRVFGAGDYIGGAYLRTHLKYHGEGRKNNNLVDSEYLDYLRDAAEFCEKSTVEIVKLCAASLSFVKAFPSRKDWREYDLLLFCCKYQQLAMSLSLSHALSINGLKTPIYFFGEALNSNQAAISVLNAFDFINGVIPLNAPSIIYKHLCHLVSRQPVAGVFSKLESQRSLDRETMESGNAEDLICSISSFTPNFANFYQMRNLEPLQSILPYQSSSGCWWADKSHCSFCGLIEEGRKFTAKNGNDLVLEILDLVKKNEAMHVVTSDLLLHHDYFKNFVPDLMDADVDVTFFYEVKASLSKKQLNLLKQAKINHLQVGIESFNTETLEGMGKGTTFFQNVRFLKWCAELGINASWILLYGFPEDGKESYDFQSSLLKKLGHLQPPISVTRVRVERNSPMHREPEKYGLKILGPDTPSLMTYPLSEDVIKGFCREFEYEKTSPEVGLTVKIENLKRSVLDWRNSWSPCSLYYRKGVDFIKICDFREGVQGNVVTLSGWQSRVFLAIDDAVSLVQIIQGLGSIELHQPTEKQIRSFLSDLESMDLVIADGKKWMSLVPRADMDYLSRRAIENRGGLLVDYAQ